MEGAVHYFNHLWVNPDSTRFALFHVWIKNRQRHTRLITCNMDGSEPYSLIDKGRVSHFTWKSYNEILCFSTNDNGEMMYYMYKDRTGLRNDAGNMLPKEDGHPSYSPDRTQILLDTYPDHYGDRHLLLYDIRNDSLQPLGSFFSPFNLSPELRCDLHPRWSPSGRFIAFDSSHERTRNIYVTELSSAQP